MTLKRRRNAGGFTLLELIIALSISSIVLIGSFSMLSSMVQYEVEGMRKGSVNGWSLASLVAMNREIEGASVLVYPTAGGSADALVVCSNWSRLMNTTGGAPLGAGPTRIYTYCWDAASNALRRMNPPGAGSCPGVGYTPPACTVGSYGSDSLIATGVYRDASNNFIFTADPATAGTVRIRYTVGKATPGTALNEGNGMTKFVNPQTMTFDTRLTLDKSLGAANTGD